MGLILDTVIRLKKEKTPLKLLIYGKPGRGKTTLAATADIYSETAKCLYFSVEDGELALTEPEVYGGTEGISIIRINSYKKFRDLCQELIDESDTHGFKTIVVDTVNVLAKLLLFDLVEQWNIKYPNKKREDFEIQLQDYSGTNKQFFNIIDDLKNTRLNFILLAHERINSDSKEIEPDVFGAVLATLHATCDGIGYLRDAPDEIVEACKKKEIKPQSDGKYRMINFQLANHMVKDRTPGSKLGKYIINPTIEKIYKKAHGLKD